MFESSDDSRAAVNCSLYLWEDKKNNMKMNHAEDASPRLARANPRMKKEIRYQKRKSKIFSHTKREYGKKRSINGKGRM